MIPELKKSERKMFIFSNTFDLLHSFLIYRMDGFEIYPVLQCLEVTVHHLAKSIFDMTRSAVDEYIMTLLLRNQLQAILDFKTTSKLFGTVFGERADKEKHSIFEDIVQRSLFCRHCAEVAVLKALRRGHRFEGILKWLSF